MNKDELLKFIGNKIKEFRKKKKLNQSDLAEKIGVTNTSISEYERGNVNLDADTLFQIADILDDLNDDEREKILVNLESEDAKEVKELLQYEDETVGSIMSKDFISFNLDITIGEIIEILRETEYEDDEFNSIFIKGEKEEVIGVVSLKDLILNKPDVKVKEIMNEKTNSLRYDLDIDEAIEKCAKYDLMSIPVVDENEVLIGVVNTHDLIDEILYPIWKRKNK